MIDPLSRRDVLKQAAIASIIIGFPWSARAGDDDPKYLKDALGKAAKNDGFVIAIVVPDDEKGRAELAKRVEALFPIDVPYELKELLVEAAFVCAPAKLAQAKDGETVVLLDKDGKRVAGDKLDLADPAKAVAAIAELAHGDGRLAARAKKARTAEVAAAIQKLADEQYGPGWQYLAGHIEACSAALIDERLNGTNAKIKARIQELIRAMSGDRFEGDPGRLPFGVEWSEKWHQPKPCPPCGMARATLESRKLVRFLAS